MSKKSKLKILNTCNPFKINKTKLNNTTIKALKDTRNGKNLSKTFDNVDEMFEDLDK